MHKTVIVTDTFCLSDWTNLHGARHMNYQARALHSQPVTLETGQPLGPTTMSGILRFTDSWSEVTMLHYIWSK